MLQARRASIWTNRYDISIDGVFITRWEPSWWRSGGTFNVDGRAYRISSNAFGTTYQLVDDAGIVAAVARRVGRKHWTVETGRLTYEFRRPSSWRQREELISNGVPVGAIVRPSMWRADAVADLPGLPPAIALFVLCTVLAKWDAAAAAAAAA